MTNNIFYSNPHETRSRIHWWLDLTMKSCLDAHMLYGEAPGGQTLSSVFVPTLIRWTISFGLLGLQKSKDKCLSSISRLAVSTSSCSSGNLPHLIHSGIWDVLVERTWTPVLPSKALSIGMISLTRQFSQSFVQVDVGEHTMGFFAQWCIYGGRLSTMSLITIIGSVL